MLDPTQQPEAVQAMARALEASVTALDDWLHLFASELCNEERVQQAKARIRQHGSHLGYIANVQQANRDALTAHLAQHPDQAGAVVPDPWRPIETAPPDGEFVDLWVHDSLRQEGERWTDCRCSYGLWFTAETERVAAYDWLHITHWRPLPTPPAEPSP